jgi:hypothetical protein
MASTASEGCALTEAVLAQGSVKKATYSRNAGKKSNFGRPVNIYLQAPSLQ